MTLLREATRPLVPSLHELGVSGLQKQVHLTLAVPSGWCVWTVYAGSLATMWQMPGTTVQSPVTVTLSLGLTPERVLTHSVSVLAALESTHLFSFGFDHSVSTVLV